MKRRSFLKIAGILAPASVLLGKSFLPESKIDTPHIGELNLRSYQTDVIKKINQNTLYGNKHNEITAFIGRNPSLDIINHEKLYINKMPKKKYT